MNNINPEMQVTNPNNKKGLAIASLVLGIVSIVLFCLWYICIPCAILALIFGIIARKESPNGNGMATAGIVLSIISLALCVLGIIGILSFINEFEDVLNSY